MTLSTRKRDQRLELRTTTEERELINEAVRCSGTDLTSFALGSLLESSRRVLADRDEFALTAEQAREWERINDAPSRELPGLVRLMARKSPFTS